MRNICLLGASGSIGRQTIDVMKKNPQDFNLVGFSVGRQTRKISSILKLYPNIKFVCIGDKNKISYYKKKYPKINFFYGDEGLLLLIDNSHPDMVVNALVGFVGLKPTLFALEHNLIVALANKEALVVGGELVNNLLAQGHGKLYPIDSEHVAISKCLKVDNKNVSYITLTASGGAFRKLTRNELKIVTPEDALKHPTWKMGNKITIDCASMANKCFEIIEAHYLFNYKYNDIHIHLHDESYVHSYVTYKDGSMRLDYGKPDMRKPIKYALYETMTPFITEVTDSLDKYSKLHFHQFDIERYPLVALAKIVIEKKGTYGACLNAANEVAVHAFLKHQIPFLDIERIVFTLMKNHHSIPHPTYEQIQQVDQNTRQKAYEMIKKGGKL